MHHFQVIAFDEVLAVFNHPDTKLGENIFIDARNDDLFEAGHIPGAIQCDHYQLEDYIDEVIDYAYEATKVIVYCNGGDCTDSIYVCRDLVEDWDVPFDAVYLYEGGWKEWQAREQPVEFGLGH